MQDAFFAAARTLARFLCLRGTIDSGNDERATSASIQLQHSMSRLQSASSAIRSMRNADIG
jgi:hypothetical protein